MIGKIVKFLQEELNTNFKTLLGDNEGEDEVVFLGGDKVDPISFKLGAVTLLLINIEEEKTLREANRYTRKNTDGDVYSTQPEIRLNLLVLFVSRYKDYIESLTTLTDIVTFFQNSRVFTEEDYPDSFPKGGDKIILEMVTLPLAQQNEVWNALRTTYLPSVLYRVKMVVISDKQQESTPLPVISETIIKTDGKD